MKAREAAVLSTDNCAVRYDQKRHCYIFHAQRSHMMVMTDVPDPTSPGFGMWEKRPATEADEFDDWMPSAPRKRRSHHR